MEGIRHTGESSNKKKNFHVTMSISPLENLKRLGQALPRENRKIFARKYGSIIDLLFIQVEIPPLIALAQYWNSSLRCFELPHLDITPTIEEYACMLGLPMKKDTAIYFHQGSCISDIKTIERFGELLGVPANQIRLMGHAESRGLSRTFLENYLGELERRQNWDTFARVLALSIYGLILFPSAFDIVDQAAMEIFFAVETKGRNPVPAVLSETFLTLDFCHQKQKGKIRCCAQLLYVWIMTHMYAGNCIDSASHPLRNFERIPVKQMNEHAWKGEFDNVEVQSFKWVCPWYGRERGEIIYSCGKFPNVPLMGPRGCISYTPAIVLRQLCWTQREPHDEQLGGICFRYKDGEHTRSLSKEVMEAWRDVKMAGRAELGKPIVIHTSGYVKWREARLMHKDVHKAQPVQETPSQSTSQVMEQLEVMRAQMQLLEQQKEAMELEVVIARSRCEKKERIIERLKDEMADEAETPKTRKGKEKVSENLLRKLQKLEERVLSLSKEKHELKEKIEQQNKIEERLMEEINAQRQAKEQLEGEVYNQFQARAELEEKVEDLTIMLEKTCIDRDQGWNSYEKCHDALVEAAKVGRMWKDQAWEWKADKEECERKYEKVMGEMSHYVPNFIRRFEKADEQIRTDLTLRLPAEVDDFMEMCGGLAKGLKRKKRKLLM